MKKIFYSLMVFVLFLCPLLADIGTVDWEEGVWRAESSVPLSGKGSRGMQIKKAHDFAKLEAMANLLQMIKGTSVSMSEKGLQTAEDFTVDKTIMAEISGYLNNVQEEKYEVFEDFGVEWVRVVVVSGLYGSKNPGSVILKESAKKEKAVLDSINTKKLVQPKVSVKTGEPVIIAKASDFPVVKETPGQVKIYSENPRKYYPINKSDKPYTGLIIDAMGFKLDKCMSPKIRLENGDVVWTGSNFTMDTLFEKGILSYASSMEKAKAHERAGSNPLIIRCVSVMGNGTGRYDVCLTADDAAYMKEANRKDKFLDNFNIVAVTDYSNL